MEVEGGERQLWIGKKIEGILIFCETCVFLNDGFEVFSILIEKNKNS